MNRNKILKKVVVIAAVSLIMAMPFQEASAEGWRRDLPRRHEVVVVRNQRYHYSDGRFFRAGLFGLGFFLVAPPIGAVITVLPAGRRTILVGGARYYYYDNTYYRDCPGGYVVVQQPVATNVVTTPSNVTYGERITINVPNSNGSYTPVTLVKHNNGYVGPQGEFYPGHPTVDQLRALYSK